jgi:hypothetical protein
MEWIYRLGSPPISYEEPGFKFRFGDRLYFYLCFSFVLGFLQANCGTMSQSRPTLPPFTSFPVYYSLIHYLTLYGLKH